MSDFHYAEIERELVRECPELSPADECYWKMWGEPGTDPGPYVFVGEVFSTYIEVLLWLPVSPRRDELLRRAFALVEQMLLAADRRVRELAFVEILEGQDAAWLRLARGFVGRRGRAYLRRWNDSWPGSGRLDLRELICPRIIDLHNVRGVIANELRLPLDMVPGETRTPDG